LDEVAGALLLGLVVAFVNLHVPGAVAADGVVEIAADAAATGEDGIFAEALFPQDFVEGAVAEVVGVQERGSRGRRGCGGVARGFGGRASSVSSSGGESNIIGSAMPASQMRPVTRPRTVLSSSPRRMCS